MNIKNFFATAKTDKVNELRLCQTEGNIRNFAKENNISMTDEDVRKVMSLIKLELKDTDLTGINGGVGETSSKIGFCTKHNCYISENNCQTNCKQWDDSYSEFSRTEEMDYPGYKSCRTCIYLSKM